MSEHIIVEFVGFQSKALAREYTFTVRESASEPREFTLTIANEAFVSHRARYQDAPHICSLKLHRELATYANHPPETHFCITSHGPHLRGRRRLSGIRRGCDRRRQRGKVRRRRPRDGHTAGRRPESVDQPAEVSPGNNRVPGEESRSGDREPEEHQVEEEEEHLAPEAFVAQRGRIVVHEMRQDGGRDSVTQEQIAEPEAGDHRWDDLP